MNPPRDVDQRVSTRVGGDLLPVVGHVCRPVVLVGDPHRNASRGVVAADHAAMGIDQQFLSTIGGVLGTLGEDLVAVAGVRDIECGEHDRGLLARQDRGDLHRPVRQLAVGDAALLLGLQPAAAPGAVAADRPLELRGSETTRALDQ